MSLCAHCEDGNHHPFDPDPECECPCHNAPDEEEQHDDGPGHCIICDGVGHAYITGWHEVPGKGQQPIIGGGPCPLEEQGRWDFEEDELPF